MKKIFHLPAFVFMLIFFSACSNYYNRKANAEYDAMNYSRAINHYEKALKKNSYEGSREKLAHSYLKMNRVPEAEKAYLEVIKRGELSVKGHLDYATILLENGKHVEAFAWVNNYLRNYPDDLFAEMIVSSIISVHEKYRDTTLYSVHTIENNEFNSVFGARPYEDGIVVTADKIVFSGRKENPWTGTSYLDLYYIPQDSTGKWMKPVLLKGDINGRFHEGPATFNSVGDIVYFTRSSYLKNNKLDKNENNISNLKIYTSELGIGGKWGKPEPFPFNSDDYSCGHPTLSSDEKILYFISDMPGGFGGTDIYKTVFDGTKWSTPENLGPAVNSEGNEMFPYVHSDGTLYFSSDAHNTLGGLDVFMTTQIGNKWARPENLNYPLNSNADDFSYVQSNDVSGFVTSSRVDGKDKLFSFTKNEPTFVLFGKARKKGSEETVEGVIVEITNADTKDVIKKITDKDGKFEMKLKPETEYLLYCTKLGCFTRTDNISTKGKKYSEYFYADFIVEEIVIDKPIVLENIFYDFDKWEIRADAALELDKLVKILNDNPAISIELSSHTDWRGSDEYNMVLSDKRARAAVDYIIFRGISPSRITAKGYGETKPLNECTNYVECSEEEHQLNRRTEFKVTKIDKGATVISTFFDGR